MVFIIVSAGTFVGAGVESLPNVLEVVVANGPHVGAKYGDVIIAFGDRDKKQVRCTVDRVPLMLKGEGAEIAFQGKAKDGIQLRVMAACSGVDEM